MRIRNQRAVYLVRITSHICWWALGKARIVLVCHLAVWMCVGPSCHFRHPHEEYKLGLLLRLQNRMVTFREVQRRSCKALLWLHWCIPIVDGVHEMICLNSIMRYEVSSVGRGSRFKMFWFGELTGERGQVVFATRICFGHLRHAPCCLVKQSLLGGKQCLCVLIQTSGSNPCTLSVHWVLYVRREVIDLNFRSFLRSTIERKEWRSILWHKRGNWWERVSVSTCEFQSLVHMSPVCASYVCTHVSDVRACAQISWFQNPDQETGGWNFEVLWSSDGLEKVLLLP